MKKIGFILIILLVAFSSCKKKKEVKLVGQWEVIPMTVQPETYQYKWVFYDDGRLEVTNYETTQVSCEYTLDQKFPKFYISITGGEYNGGDYNGIWRIDELTNDILKICREEDGEGSSVGAFLRLEFLKI